MSELRRRLVHASGTGLPALYLSGTVSYRELGLLYVGLSAVVAGLEWARLGLGYEWALFDQLARAYERDNVAGYALYAFSQTAVVLLLGPNVALPAALMLIIGDPVSGYLGSNDAGNAKELGTLGAMFGVCFLLAAPFTLSLAGGAVGIAAAAAGALGATVADGVKPVVAGYVVDDNLSIPPAAAAGILAVLAAAGG